MNAIDSWNWLWDTGRKIVMLTAGLSITCSAAFAAGYIWWGVVIEGWLRN